MWPATKLCAVTVGMAGPIADMMLVYRPQLCFWNSVVLYFTLLLTAAQALATALNTFFQLTIMLMILVIGLTALAHFQPFPDPLLQRMQVIQSHSRAVAAALHALSCPCNDTHLNCASVYVGSSAIRSFPAPHSAA